VAQRRSTGRRSAPLVTVAGDDRAGDARACRVIRSAERPTRTMADDGPGAARYGRSMGAATPVAIRGIHRVQEWARARPSTVDVGLAVVMAVIAVIEVGAAPEPGEQQADLGAYLLVAAGCLALVWRRAAPLLVAAVATAVLCAYWAAGYSSLLAPLGLPALYSLVVHDEDRRRAWVAYSLMCATLVVVASLTVLDTEDGFAWLNAAGMMVYLAATGVVAAVVRNRQRIFVDTQRRAEQAEADRLAEAERAVARERLRIAREMHDVVAHGMSAVAVQAAAAREVARTNPEQVERILERIEVVSRESLAELRRMLGVLRNTDDQDTSLAPQPSLDDVAIAVARSVQSGVATELVVTGTPVELPPGVGLAAYRIVQEALTNVRKHAGSRASATVAVEYRDGSVVVEVTDDGLGAASSLAGAGGGNGLIGMAERVDAYGGRFTAAPRPGGGYAVRAELPTTDPGRPAVAVDSDVGTGPS
jgi:signal transduction histidine kinase